MNETTKPTVGLGPKVGFAESLRIRSYSDFEDEPTIPFGLCQSEGLEDLVVETLEVVKEQDIIDDLPLWMVNLLNHLIN